MTQTCTARTKNGRQCRNPAIPGGNVCRIHGGNAPQVRAKAQARLAEQQAQQQARLLGARQDIHPAEALLELVQRTASEVAYWRERVTQLDPQLLTWGITEQTTKTSPDGTETTSKHAAQAHIAYRLYIDAANRLANYSTAALKAGIDERRIQLAEQQGSLVENAIRQILNALNLTPTQQALIPTVVPAALRLIGTQENQ